MNSILRMVNFKLYGGGNMRVFLVLVIFLVPVLIIGCDNTPPPLPGPDFNEEIREIDIKGLTMKRFTLKDGDKNKDLYVIECIDVKGTCREKCLESENEVGSVSGDQGSALTYCGTISLEQIEHLGVKNGIRLNPADVRSGEFCCISNDIARIK